MKSAHLVLALLFLPTILAEPNTCTKGSECNDDQSFDEVNKYSKEQNLPEKWQSYLDEIEKAAKEAFTENSEKDNCALFTPRADKDLFPFKAISESMLDELSSKVRHSVVYQILDGKLYRSNESSCLFPMRCLGVEYFLLRVAKDLNDTQFVVNYHDWPHLNRYIETTPQPLFSFSKTEDYYDIMYPAWSFWAGGPATNLHPRGLGRWDRLREQLLSSDGSKRSWSSKIRKAFFRGSRTSSERDNLVLLSRANPEIVDAKFTKNQAWRSKADTLGEDPASEVSLEAHCDYRYLFNLRGVAASFRFRHLFLCKSLVLHVGSEWKEFFYDALKPWLHFVPVDKDASVDELRSIINFVVHFDDGMRKIAERGSKFIEKELTMAKIECYWTYLLQQYTRRLAFKPRRVSAFVEVQHSTLV